ncbi:MAG: MlaD family protein [Actinomycetota bacterium]|nr:MlaD family protein [Actinomycetota bacterium]
MSPDGQGARPQVRRSGGIGRLAALGALVLAVIAIAFVLFSGGDEGNKYRLLFETGGQLVEGNQVLIGGSPVGSVDTIELRDDAQAEVTISIDQELHQGTSAVIRSTSLSGVANRYISITPGPDNEPELGADALITQVDTTTPVDLDQLFNTIREPERKALQNIIQGSADVYEGRGPEANQTYLYLSPALNATTRLIEELNADQRVFSNFLVSGSRVVTAVAERRDDLAALTSNGNQALGAIASQNENLDRALRALPPALRQANTTFFNLRPTLDDLDQLVDTAKPATKDLAPFLRQLKPVVAKSVPVFKDLRLAVNKTGKNNDLADATGKLVPLRNAADRAAEPTVQAMIDSEETFTFLRPYAPDLLNTIGKLGQITAGYDANGHIARVQTAGLGIFENNAGSLDPIAIADQFAGYGPFGGANFNVFRRCPGGQTQPAADGSSPFLDNGLLTSPAPPGDCTVTDVPPGP